MINTNLLKVIKGVSKNGKIYYSLRLVVGSEIINCFIYKSQYDAIVAELSEQERQAKLLDLTNN